MIALRFAILTLLMISAYGAVGQELFPLSEPASSTPKNALGVRLFSETYKEVNQIRNVTGLRLMYGISSKFSVYATALASNHHGEKMPSEFPFHNTPERGAKYPYKFNGFHLYGKYRFLTHDRQNMHFRMAAFAEGAFVNTTHHETEPNLMKGDNTGLGAGLIATYLKGKFAVSATSGVILPAGYSGLSPDPIASLPDVPVRIQYGKALTYHLSFGYLLLPQEYKSYRQPNLNFYLELHGSAFQAAKVDLFVGMPEEYYLASERYPSALQAGYFIDISPGVQLILNSNFRIDFSTTFSSIGNSYTKLYPLYTVGLQHYFYNVGKRKS